MFRLAQWGLPIAAAAVVKPDFIPAGAIGTHPAFGVLVRIVAFFVVFLLVRAFSPSSRGS